VRDGGELILLKGANVASEVDAARKQIKSFRLSDVRVEAVGDGLLEEPTRVLRARVRA
jgi:16S rRNA (guanine527-N7)-methyltransferase